MEIKSGDRVQFDANERRLLKGFGGNIGQTAKRIGTTRQTLSRVMNEDEAVSWKNAAGIIGLLLAETAGLGMKDYPTHWRAFLELYNNAQQGKALYTALAQQYGNEGRRMYNEAWEPAAKMNDESPEQK